VSPNGATAYVTNSRIDSVFVIDTATGTLTMTIPVGLAPGNVAFSPDGSRAYVTNRGESSVSGISTATNTVIATIPVGEEPAALVVTPDGSRVYVGQARATCPRVRDRHCVEHRHGDHLRHRPRPLHGSHEHPGPI